MWNHERDISDSLKAYGKELNIPWLKTRKKLSLSTFWNVWIQLTDFNLLFDAAVWKLFLYNLGREILELI